MINKRIFNETRKSLIRINILVVITFLILFSVFIFGYFKDITYKKIDQKLKDELKYITTQLSNEYIFNYISTKYPNHLVYIYEDGRIKYYTQSWYFNKLLPSKGLEFKEGINTYKENGYSFRGLDISIGNYEIKIIRNIDAEISSLKQLIFVFIVGIVIAFIISYLLAIYLTRKALIPIEKAWNNQAKFIQDASHELRTPITIISSKLENMLRNPKNTITDEVETIADAMAEVRKSKTMINDLLYLMKEEAISKLNISNININELLNDIHNEYTDIAQIYDKRFKIEVNKKDIILNTDINKLRQLIVIILDNAFKYTKENDTITIKFVEGDKYSSIFIIDTGVGIKPCDIPYIFDRFYRSEDARKEDIEGCGIGLSIAKMIGINLNANIKVTSTPNIETIFEIVLPNKM